MENSSFFPTTFAAHPDYTRIKVFEMLLSPKQKVFGLPYWRWFAGPSQGVVLSYCRDISGTSSQS